MKALTVFRPMLFSTPMVQAILGDYKNQTRRTKGLEFINKNPDNWRFDGKATAEDGFTLYWFEELKNGKPTENYQYVEPTMNIGDIIWVRETFQITDFLHPTDENYGYIYKASENGKEWENNSESWKWKPSLFMPKSACRLFLEITDIKVERLQSISESDSLSEGVENCIADKENFGCRVMGMRLFRDYLRKDNSLKNYPNNGYDNAKASFETLWYSINGKDSWKENPWVWVISFKRVEKPNGFL